MFHPMLTLIGALGLAVTAGTPAPDAATPHVHVTEANGYRYIVSDGLPNHATGQFPNRGNPNTIQLQYYRFRVPLNPVAAARPEAMDRMLFGVALNGVPFDPGTAEYWYGDPNWRYEALSGKINLGLDFSNAHVQPNGAYHYHGEPEGLVATLGKNEAMQLVGYAADGFPIYNSLGYRNPNDPASGLVALRSSWRLKPGERRDGPGGPHDGTFVQDYEYVAGSGDLDECNGRQGVTPEFPGGTYYYVITDTFPFIPRYFRGTPDDSFRRKGPPQGGGGRRGGPGGPPPPPRRIPPPY